MQWGEDLVVDKVGSGLCFESFWLSHMKAGPYMTGVPCDGVGTLRVRGDMNCGSKFFDARHMCTSLSQRVETCFGLFGKIWAGLTGGVAKNCPV